MPKAETRKGSKGHYEPYNRGPPPRHDVGDGASGGETSTGPVFGQQEFPPGQGRRNSRSYQDTGYPVSGQLNPGQPIPGYPIPGQLNPGQPIPGQPNPGYPFPGQRSLAQLNPGQPILGQSNPDIPPQWPPARPYTREYQQGNQHRPNAQPTIFLPQPPTRCPLTVVESVTVNLGDIKDIKNMRVENTSEENDEKVKKNFAGKLITDANIWAAYIEGPFSSLEALDRLLAQERPRSIIIKYHDDDD